MAAVDRARVEAWLKNAAAIGIFAFVIFGISYCEELPKYRFEKTAAADGATIPGGRLVYAMKTGDLASPVSWFWPAKTAWTYAVPDPEMDNRFTLIGILYDERDPVISLVDVDCQQRSVKYYATGAGDGEPAVDANGQEVRTRKGELFRALKFNDPLPPEEMHQLCDTDWTQEREAAQNAAAR